MKSNKIGKITIDCHNCHRLVTVESSIRQALNGFATNNENKCTYCDSKKLDIVFILKDNKRILVKLGKIVFEPITKNDKHELELLKVHFKCQKKYDKLEKQFKHKEIDMMELSDKHEALIDTAYIYEEFILRFIKLKL
ncbi:MAG: hypothetical protein DRG78_07235 [Epsilonproteobacteria bacterium]|nr:MAG: hypothetical protein DRG78_07235 [Campylobacterota bacterium]